MTETGYLTISAVKHRHNKKNALIDRLVQNSIDICTSGHLGYLFVQCTLHKMVNFRKADKKTNMQLYYMRVKHSKF